MRAPKGENLMAMEDILKTLVDSRQQGSSTQGGDAMTNLIGGLLGGGQSQSNGGQSGADLIGGIASLLGSVMGGAQQGTQSAGGQQSAGGLSDMMGLLEGVIGGQSGGANDPIMALLNPYIAPLAKKAKISPEIATIVISFVVHQLLAHHPTSGRDSTSFNLDNMLQQMGSGKIDPGLLQNSGMVKEIAAKTGLDEATAQKSLEVAFSLVGKGVSSLINRNK